MRSIAQSLVKVTGNKPDTRILKIFLDALQSAASSEAMQQYRADFYKSILTKTSATVWVCPDDLSGFDAITFLNKTGRKIPDEIAVAAFDDMSVSLGHELTTYNFNMTGMVQQALRMIFEKRTLFNTPATSEVDGYVVERRTTRR